MSDKRYYAKKQYTGNWSAVGTALVFILVGILGIIFMFVPGDFIGLSTWGYYMFIPAFFILIGAISGLYNDRRYKKSVLVTAQSKGNSSASLENLSMETGIRANDILRILVDLRNEGLVKYRYDTSTGEIVFGESASYVQSTEFDGPMTKRQAEVQTLTGASYCPYCGHKPPAGANFCENCGSKM
jgi:hypothetical protein